MASGHLQNYTITFKLGGRLYNMAIDAENAQDAVDDCREQIPDDAEVKAVQAFIEDWK